MNKRKQNDKFTLQRYITIEFSRYASDQYVKLIVSEFYSQMPILNKFIKYYVKSDIRIYDQNN